MRSGEPQSALGSTRVMSSNFMNLGDDDVAPFRVAAQSANRVKGDPRACQDQRTMLEYAIRKCPGARLRRAKTICAYVDARNT